MKKLFHILFRPMNWRQALILGSIIVAIAWLGKSFYLEIYRRTLLEKAVSNQNLMLGVRSISNALDTYYEENGYFPAAGQGGLQALVPKHIATLPEGNYLYAYCLSEAEKKATAYHLGAKIFIFKKGYSSFGYGANVDTSDPDAGRMWCEGKWYQEDGIPGGFDGKMQIYDRFHDTSPDFYF